MKLRCETMPEGAALAGGAGQRAGAVPEADAERTAPILRRALATAWRWLHQGSALKRKPRRLRVSETVSLGDKRFVSILEVDGQSFLIGGGAGGVSLLSTLIPSQAGEPKAAIPGEVAGGPSAESFDGALDAAWRRTA